MTAGAVRHTLGGLALALMLLGSFALWIGVPALVLWALGKVVESKSDHLLLSLLAVPSAMVIFAALLSRFNLAYLRFQGYEPIDDDEEDKWFPRIRSPLDRILTFSAFVAAVALIAWMSFMPTGPVQPW
jgi:hypothetical protein